MTFRHLTIAAALLVGASAALAQQQPADAPKVAEQKSVAPECAKIQPHDHWAERGYPGTKSPCKPVKSAAAKSKDKVDGHDHGKMHKNQ